MVTICYPATSVVSTNGISRNQIWCERKVSGNRCSSQIDNIGTLCRRQCDTLVIRQVQWTSSQVDRDGSTVRSDTAIKSGDRYIHTTNVIVFQDRLRVGYLGYQPSAEGVKQFVFCPNLDARRECIGFCGVWGVFEIIDLLAGQVPCRIASTIVVCKEIVQVVVLIGPRLHQSIDGGLNIGVQVTATFALFGSVIAIKFAIVGFLFTG